MVLCTLQSNLCHSVLFYQAAQMKEKDSRVKLMNEILNGMKVLKLYAWEESFHKIVSDVRQRELALLRRIGFLNAGSSFFWQCAPFFVSTGQTCRLPSQPY